VTLVGEIREQPEAAARFLDRQLGPVRAIAESVRKRDPRFVLIAARGSSDHAAIYAQYVLGIRNGLPVALAAPSMFSIFGAPPRIADALVIGISQSGESPDIVAVLDEARRQGAPSIAVTNAPGSPLAAAAEHVLPLEAGPELAVAATKTYTTQLLAIAALSAALSSGREAVAVSDELHAVPAALERVLATDRAVEAIAVRLGGVERAIVIGRGYEYATARELALKIQELAQVMAHAWSSSDFEHGPLALLEPGLPLVAIVSDDVAGARLLPLLRRVRDVLGAEIIVISSRADAAEFAPILSPATLPPWLGPIVSIVPGQLLAYHLARARGLDVERPRSISKVTLTR
jgi:glucosamine--fructose-6-phosphate aminotransferase (isomerizing)